MHRPPGLRERKNAAAKAAIYQAAMELFSAQGFDETTVDQIAERAGVGRATFFNHFGTKEGVLRFYGQRLQGQAEEILGALDCSLSPLQRLRSMLDAMAREARERRMELRLVYRYSLQDPSYPNLTPAREQIWQMATELIAGAQAAGEVRCDMEARQIAYHILNLVQNAILTHVFTGEPLELLVDSAWLVLEGGIRHARSVAPSDYQV